MKHYTKHYTIGIFILFMYAAPALCDTIPYTFTMNDGSVLPGKVVRPDTTDRGIMVIFVNQRNVTAEKHSGYSELTDRFIKEGVSYCYYDNRQPQPEDSTSNSSLYDMADEAASVYRQLAKDRRFKNYKTGFIGVSEAGASALIATSEVRKPAFLIQVVTTVNSQLDTNVQAWTLNTLLPFFFIKELDMQFHEYSALIRSILERVRQNDIGDVDRFTQQLYEKYIPKTKSYNELFYPAVSRLIRMFMDTGYTRLLNWNSKQYYKSVKCPILYVSCLYDTQVPCTPNITDFEKTMFENGHKNFSTVLVSATHQLLTTEEDWKQAHAMSGNIDRTKTYEIMDLICKWLTGHGI